ncbi:MAG: TRAP transporter small permease subunit [Devosia sp.]|nr:TRAP transporter small permease subunit [Devosia sp.]
MKLLTATRNVITGLTVFVFAVIVVSIFVDIGSRQLLGQALPGDIVFVEMSFCAITFLPLILVSHARRDIRMEIFVQNASGRTALVLSIIQNLAVAVGYGLLCAGSGRHLYLAITEGRWLPAVPPVPLALPLSFVFIGTLLGLVQTLVNIAIDLTAPRATHNEQV